MDDPACARPGRALAPLAGRVDVVIGLTHRLEVETTAGTTITPAPPVPAGTRVAAEGGL